MARVKGSRNADYEQVRARLVESARRHLMTADGARASFRELAAATEVSVPTLRHYFGTREALVEEVLSSAHRQALPYLHQGATEPHGSLRTSLRWLIDNLVLGWKLGAGAAHAFGLSSGIRHSTLGPAYVRQMLEPMLQSAEARLARHMASGELPRCDVRHAALELLSPVVLGLLHQDTLFGARCRPLDLDAFLTEHLERFLKAYAAERPRARTRRARR